MPRPRPLCAFVLLAAACAAPALAPGPQGEGVCALGISVRTTRPPEARWGHPQTVYFVRVVEGADPSLAGPVIACNYTYGNIVCLLDAEPGRYVAVGCVERWEGRNWSTYFDAKLIEATMTEVKAGAVGYLGSFSLDLRMAAEPDEAQRHYEPLISPYWTSSKAVLQLFTRYRHSFSRYFSRLEESAQDEARLRQHLAASGWGNAPQRHGDTEKGAG